MPPVRQSPIPPLLLIPLLLEFPMTPRYESLIQDQFTHAELPPLWQVLYNEGIRGNHLLFQKADVAAFEADSTSIPALESESESVALQHIMVQLLACSELSTMANLIDSLSQDIKKGVYILYRQMLQSWTAHLRVSLN